PRLMEEPSEVRPPALQPLRAIAETCSSPWEPAGIVNPPLRGDSIEPSCCMLKIGAFAKRAGVSVKTLRFYDRAGVFRPAYTDPKSRYRYYAADQLVTLQELRLMRQLGAGMEDLKAWIRAPEGSSTPYTVLGRLRERLQRRLDLDRRRLQYIDQCIECASLLQKRRRVQLLRPTARPIPDMPVFALRDRVSTIGRAIYRMFESAGRAVAAQSARAPQRPFLRKATSMNCPSYRHRA